MSGEHFLALKKRILETSLKRILKSSLFNNFCFSLVVKCHNTQ
jgi:hypothetical protein